MENIRDYVHIAGANLRTNPLRSALSIMGIVVGTASVISVLALGAGARKDLLDAISRFGTEVFRVAPDYNSAKRRTGTLTVDHLEAIRRIPFVKQAFADTDNQDTARSRYGSARAKIIGIDMGFLDMRGLRLLSGRDMNPIDHEERRLVCLIRSNAPRALIGNESDAIGTEVFMLGTKWTVVGTYEANDAPKPAEPTKNAEFLVPFSTLARNASEVSIDGFEVHVDPRFAHLAKETIGNAIHRNDALLKTLYSVEGDRERIARRLENRRLLFVLWTAIASISLLVGGIGMMNVMLTSVAERTREIGLRRAIGARRKDILIQFLVESCILSMIGGVVGLFTGAAVARALPLALAEFGLRQAVMQPSFAFGSVGVGMILGITFGLYPAIKAAAFSPAEALRYD